MNAHAARKRRLSLRGWLKWIPVLAIPFSILFFHAWINIQILRADYVLRELNKEARKLTETLSSTDLAAAYHEDPEVLAARAELLEFVQPQPGQREIIRGRLTFPTDANGFTMASLDASPLPEPAVDEARSARAATIEATAPAAAPVTQAPVAQEEAAPPATATTPVVLEIAPALDSVAAPAPPAPAEVNTVTTPVVLDLPDDAFMEEPVNVLDAKMGALESL